MGPVTLENQVELTPTAMVGNLVVMHIQEEMKATSQTVQPRDAVTLT